MNRARAKALALVNWRGVFYERYLLDSHVTALEGANGAGKTTVLIGCYVVLLPDMTRLRFTNLGEHSPSGGDRGLWGRLGESSRPAYAVLELALEQGQRLLAGVHLQRKAEPTVELTPFIITSLNDSVRLQDLLLERGEMDGVPELAQLRDQVAAQGAVMHVYSTAKEYFAALFERGITPLRLAGDSDRNKLNEMLRTSMTGGISRALTSELRDFLLKEEAGLADTLKRMRSNLDACRRTRIEVEESRKLEQEIAGVYEAGQEMFAAAIHATRERADELRRRFEDAGRSAQEAEDEEQKLTTELAGKKQENERLDKNLRDAERHLADARQYLERLKRAQAIAQRMNERKEMLGQLRREHEEAVSTKEQAEASRARARKERDDAQRHLEAASASLTNHQKGLEELERRASEHSMATRRMDRAGQLLPDERIEADTMAKVLVDVDRIYADVSRQFRRLSNQVCNAEQHREEFGLVYDALLTIATEDIGPPDAFRRALAVSREIRLLEAKAAQRDELTRKSHDAQTLVEKQSRAQESASQLSTDELTLDSARTVQSALTQAEAEIESLDQRLRSEEGKAEAASRERSSLEEKEGRLERDVVAWNEILSRVEWLEKQYVQPLRTRENLQALRAKLNEARDGHRDQLGILRQKQQEITSEAAQLEQSGGTFPMSLLRARDALDGELLATQFEELTVEQAREIEALLGPLAQALVVDDPATAADALCNLDDAPDSVWLVGGDASPVIDVDGRPDGTVHDGHAIVNGGTSLRVTRIPERPTLGRRARTRRIRELREEAESYARQIDQCNVDLRDAATHLDAVNGLLTEADTLERGDPSAELNRVTVTLATTAKVEQEHRQAVAQMTTEIASVKARRTALQELLPAAWLLDEPDQQQKLNALRERQNEAKAAAERLQEVAEPRSVLESQMDVLRTPPMSATEIATMQERIKALDQEQETRLEALECLRYVDEHRVALTWTDAAAALKRKVALEPALEQQLEQARTTAQSTQAAVDEADTALDTANQAFNKVDAQVQQLVEAIRRNEEEWLTCEVESATDEDVQRADDAVIEAEKTDHRLKSKARDIGEEIARLDERRKAAAERAAQRRGERDEAERGWRPNQERWDKLEALATEHAVLSSAMTRRFVDLFGGRGSANVRSDAKEAAARLRERLSYARDSSDVVGAVNELLGTQELSGESCLQAWLTVRDWLKRRIPAQIAEVAEPVEALERLRSHLDDLEERLGRQEADLRGESSDVAKNIDIHIRRAQRQISKLNQDLGDVRFGSIHSVRLRLERVERMDQILHALRDGEAQSLLFQPDMPIETALDELFRRYGGGGRTTGQRLLDYREYIEPKVEVRRQSSEHWEVANPMRMSTGEAIGVGAALMMVVLTAWERDANLLRPKRSLGTLRLLFLDEANRLSQDNLSVLFDLCQSLDLQLIIAAPEVAQAEGNTTYRLVRRVDEAGHEEVIVSGRRLAVESQS